MKASLDTNVILHLYRSDSEHIIFNRFSDGLYVHEFIRNIELKRHGQDILERFDADVKSGKIHMIDDAYLRHIRMYPLFLEYINEEKILYSPPDWGEAYAISLARTLGLSALVTDDVKEYGPHYSLIREIYGTIIPYAFYEILILDFLEGKMSAEETTGLFYHISRVSNFHWSLRSKLGIFIRRFWTDSSTPREREWMRDFCVEHDINYAGKLKEISLLAND